MRIDTHAHLWTAAYLDAIERAGQAGTAIARGRHATDSSQDLRERFRLMDAARVDRQLLSATPQILQCEDEGHALLAAQLINDAYADIVVGYPERFLAYGAVPLPHVGAAISEARRVLCKRGFLGIAINTLVGTQSIASPRFWPFYEEMDRLGATVYIHPTGCGALSSMITEADLNWVIGAPFEDTIAILQLLKADIPYRFPRMKIHVAHLGGDFAFLMQRIEDAYEKWHAFPRSPREQLARMWFDAANFHGPALRCMVETVGHERLMLGSDYPFMRNEDYGRAVSYVEQSGLPHEVIEAILTGNALRLHGRDALPSH